MTVQYLIDSENVGDFWIPLLELPDEETELIVFYTKNSPHMSYESLIKLKESDKKVTFIKCYEGTNALDFQLVSELGYRICENEEGRFVVVTNDTGYDAAVKYWRHRLRSVKRITGKECRNLERRLREDIHGSDSAVRTQRAPRAVSRKEEDGGHQTKLSGLNLRDVESASRMDAENDALSQGEADVPGDGTAFAPAEAASLYEAENIEASASTAEDIEASGSSAENIEAFASSAEDIEASGSFAEDAFVSDDPAADSSLEGAFAADSLGGDSFAEDSAAEDSPADAYSAEDSPAEDSPAEEYSAEDSPAEDSPAADFSGVTISAEDSSLEEASAEGLTSDDFSAKDSPSEGVLVEGISSEDFAAEVLLSEGDHAAEVPLSEGDHAAGSSSGLSSARFSPYGEQDSDTLIPGNAASHADGAEETFSGHGGSENAWIDTDQTEELSGQDVSSPSEASSIPMFEESVPADAADAAKESAGSPDEENASADDSEGEETTDSNRDSNQEAASQNIFYGDDEAADPSVENAEMKAAGTAESESARMESDLRDDAADSEAETVPKRPGSDDPAAEYADQEVLPFFPDELEEPGESADGGRRPKSRRTRSRRGRGAKKPDAQEGQQSEEVEAAEVNPKEDKKSSSGNSRGRRRTGGSEKAGRTASSSETAETSKTAKTSGAEKEAAPAKEAASEKEAAPAGQAAAGAARTPSEEEIARIAACIGADNLAELHNQLATFYGDQGKDIYLSIRNGTRALPDLHPDLKQKFQYYCEIIFANGEAEEQMPDDMAEYLLNIREKLGNLNSMRYALIKHYGKDKGRRFYFLLKPYAKAMHQM